MVQAQPPHGHFNRPALGEPRCEGCCSLEWQSTTEQAHRQKSDPGKNYHVLLLNGYTSPHEVPPSTPVCEWTQLLFLTALQEAPTHLLGGKGCWEWRWCLYQDHFIEEKTEAREARPLAPWAHSTSRTGCISKLLLGSSARTLLSRQRTGQMNPGLVLDFPLNSSY